MSIEPKVILITGASSGFGRAIADHLHRQGHCVYGTSRDPNARPASEFPMLHVDLTRDDSVQRAVVEVLSREGRIDVLVNNAGYSLVGSIEDTSTEEALAQFEPIFFAAHRTIRAVLPSMRAQRSGLIVSISSIAGAFALPYQSMYSASKWALEAMSESLRMEVMEYGIRVVMIQPGDFRTGVTSNRQWAAHMSGSPYEAAIRRAVDVQAHGELTGPLPERVAHLVERVMRMKSPRLRYTVGKRFDRFAVVLSHLLPRELGQWFLMKYYQVI